MSFLCTIGLHSCDWRWAGPENSCKQVKHCQRYPCDFSDERDKHDFQLPPDGRLIYVSDEDDCIVHGVCIRCGKIGGRMGPYHRWGPNQHRYDEDQEVLIAWQPCLHCRAYRERPAVPVEFVN